MSDRALYIPQLSAHRRRAERPTIPRQPPQQPSAATPQTQAQPEPPSQLTQDLPVEVTAPPSALASTVTPLIQSPGVAIPPAAIPLASENKWMFLSKYQRGSAVLLLVHEEQRDLVTRIAVQIGAPGSAHSPTAQNPVLQPIHSFVSKKKLPKYGQRKWFYINSSDKTMAARLLVGHRLYHRVIEVALEFHGPLPPLRPLNTRVSSDRMLQGGETTWFYIPDRDVADGARMLVHESMRDHVVRIAFAIEPTQAVPVPAPAPVPGPSKSGDTSGDDPVKFMLIVLLTLCISIPFSCLIYT